MLPPLPPCLILTLVSVLTFVYSCGPEREFSGIWRQEIPPEPPPCKADGGGESPACDNRHVYELHVGRYGDDVAGLFMRYAADAIDPFEAGEVDCFYLRGGRSSADGFQFGILRHDRAACPDLWFTLEGNDERLEARVECSQGVKPGVLAFLRARGSARTSCQNPHGETE